MRVRVSVRVSRRGRLAQRELLSAQAHPLALLLRQLQLLIDRLLVGVLRAHRGGEPQDVELDRLARDEARHLLGAQPQRQPPPTQRLRIGGLTAEERARDWAGAGARAGAKGTAAAGGGRLGIGGSP